MFQNNEAFAFLAVISFVTLGSKEEVLHLVRYLSARSFIYPKTLFH